MGITTRRMAAKKVLDGAKKYASKDVIVVSKDKAGEIYLASSMPSGHSLHIAQQIAMVNEALKQLKRIQRHQMTREAKAAA